MCSSPSSVTCVGPWSRAGVLAAAGALAGALALPAAGEIISVTASPYSSVFWPWGAGVHVSQSVAFRIDLDRHYRFDDISPWFWNNNGASPDIVRLTIRPDRWTPDGYVPGEPVLDTIDFVCPAGGLSHPIEFTVSSAARPVLRSGRRYWFVAESEATGGSPVWSYGGADIGFVSYAAPRSAGFWTGIEAAIFAHTIRGTPLAGGCAADLTTTAIGGPGYGIPDGVRTNDDFFYYLARFGVGDLIVADMTTTATPGSPGYGEPNGMLNNDDFFYFLSLFAAGC